VLEILRTNLDYLILIRSWALILLALGTWTLSRGETKRGWGWLGLFALVQAVQAWIELVAVDHPGTAARAWLQHGTFAGGLLLASAFCYRSAPPTRLMGRSRRWLVTLLLVGGSAALAGTAPDSWPAQLLRLVGATALAIPLWWRQAGTYRRGLPAPQAVSWCWRHAGCVSLLLLAVTGGLVAGSLAGTRQDAAMRAQVLARAQLGAAAVEVADLRPLQWSEADLRDPHYLRLKELMAAMRRANGDLRFALLAGLRQGRAYFIADNEAPSSPDYSPPGQAYAEAAPDYLRGMASRQPFLVGPVTDRWGTWIIASVPVADLGARGAVNFELDLTAANWDALVRGARLPAVLITLLISLLILGSFEVQEHLRRQAAEMRRAKEAAEAATRAKSEFLAVMSHEIRTPLGGVIGMLDLLSRTAKPSDQRQYTAVARDSAETLLHLVDDILDTAKVESGKLTLESLPFRPREEFRHVLAAARLRAEKKGLDFQFRVAATVPEVLVGDPTRLRQVVNNLLGNALKFTEHGGIFVTIDGERDAGGEARFRLQVRDTGIGIAGDARDRLFAKFSQEDVSTTRRFGGTGLGLAIVRGLAEHMGGTATVESARGAGSTFTFTARLAVGSDRARLAPAGTEASTGELPRPEVLLRVLCAEDDPTNRTIAEAFVTAMGHVIAVAHDGQAALERLRRETFDVVLMDSRMPVLDGFEATRRIRGSVDWATPASVHIIAVTANASGTDRDQCLARGMDDFLTKPLLRPALHRALAEASRRLLRRGVTLPAMPAERGTGAPLERADPPLDLPAALDRAGGDRRLLGALAESFCGEFPRTDERLRTALDAGDAAGAELAAHTLVGGLLIFSADRAADAARAVEEAARVGNWNGAAEALLGLEREMDAVRPRLEDLAHAEAVPASL